jgi:hypothetical protein
MPFNPQTYNVQFLSEASLKEEGVVNENVDMKIIKPIIMLCQQKYMLPTLGTGLYVDLQNKIYDTVNNVSGGTPLNQNEINLIEVYIKPALKWVVLRDLPLYTTYKMMNKGLSSQSSDTSQPAPLDILESYQAYAKQNAEMFTQQLSNYLLANTSLFPAYFRIVTIDDIAPHPNQYTTSVNLSRGRRFGSLSSDCFDCAKAFYLYNPI